MPHAQGGYEYVRRDDCMRVCPYIRSYLFHMHVRHATTRRLYVRTLRKSSRHSSPSRLITKTSILASIIIITSTIKNSFIFLEFSFPICCIFLFSTIAPKIFPQIVFNLPSNVLQLSIAFSFSISSLFLHKRHHTLTITLENYDLAASLVCCCCYMSFQHICKLYTCWLRLILYLIKQF